MSASQTASGATASKLRSSRLGAIAWEWRLSVVIGARRLRRGWTNAVFSHELDDRALRDAQAVGLQLGMDPRRAVAPLALLEYLPDL